MEQICQAGRKIGTTYSLYEPVSNGDGKLAFYTKLHLITSVDGKLPTGPLYTKTGNEDFVKLGWDDKEALSDRGGTTYRLVPLDTSVVNKCGRCVGNPKRECDLSAWTIKDLEPQSR